LCALFAAAPPAFIAILAAGRSSIVEPPLRAMTWIAAHLSSAVAVGSIDDEEMSFIVGVD
jgi:hypothetical protein